MMPGPPFVFGAFLVILAILVAAFIPDGSPALFSIDEEKGRKRMKDEERSRKRPGREESIKLSDENLTSESDTEYCAPLIRVML